jgi:hypothetical protein
MRVRNITLGERPGEIGRTALGLLVVGRLMIFLCITGIQTDFHGKDPSEFPPCLSVGLRSSQGNAQPDWARWKSLIFVSIRRLHQQQKFHWCYPLLFHIPIQGYLQSGSSIDQISNRSVVDICQEIDQIELLN